MEHRENEKRSAGVRRYERVDSSIRDRR